MYISSVSTSPAHRFPGDSSNIRTAARRHPRPLIGSGFEDDERVVEGVNYTHASGQPEQGAATRRILLGNGSRAAVLKTPNDILQHFGVEACG